jgi:hypothetical protein
VERVSSFGLPIQFTPAESDRAGRACSGNLAEESPQTGSDIFVLRDRFFGSRFESKQVWGNFDASTGGITAGVIDLYMDKLVGGHSNPFMDV